MHPTITQVTCPSKIWRKVATWHWFANGLETSGTGAFRQDDDKIRVEEIWLNSSLVSKMSTRQDPDTIIDRLIEGTELGYTVQELNLYWHTHSVNAFWSPTDQKAIEKYATGMDVLSICFSPTGNVARIDHRENEVLISYRVPVVISMPESEIEEYERIMEAKKHAAAKEFLKQQQLTVPEQSDANHHHRGWPPGVGDGDGDDTAYGWPGHGWWG